MENTPRPDHEQQAPEDEPVPSIYQEEEAKNNTGKADDMKADADSPFGSNARRGLAAIIENWEKPVIVVGGSIGIIIAIWTLCLLIQQTKLLSQQIQLAERPWIAADLAINGDWRITDGAAYMPIKVLMSNYGHSPAVRSFVEVTIDDFRFSKSDVYGEVIRLCNFASNEADSHQATFLGQTLFPWRSAAAPHLF